MSKRTDQDEEAADFSKHIRSRQEFNLLRANNTNSVRLVHKFFHEDGLQDMLAMIPAGGQFLHNAYSESYQAMREGVDEQVKFAANRSTFGWWRETTLKITHCNAGPEILGSFSMMPKTSTNYPADSEIPWVRDQCNKAEIFDTTCLASNDAWSELTFSVTFRWS